MGSLFTHCLSLFITVHAALKNIKNWSHDTIHAFKNYFATVLSVFSFQFSVSATINSIQTDPKRLVNITLTKSISIESVKTPQYQDTKRGFYLGIGT